MILALTACKKKETYSPHEVSQSSSKETDSSDQSVEWEIITPTGTYKGHRLDITANTVEFVTADGYKMYVNGNWTVSTQGK
jgi:hypothetical protein